MLWYMFRPANSPLSLMGVPGIYKLPGVLLLLVCWCIIHICSCVVAWAHGGVRAGHQPPLSGSDGGIISCHVRALMSCGRGVFCEV